MEEELVAAEGQNELAVVSDKVAEIEFKLVQIKAVEDQAKALKEELYGLMNKYNVKKWTTSNGVQITKIDGKEDTTEVVEEFNLLKLKEEAPEVYVKYAYKTTKVVRGRKGSLRITLPKIVDTRAIEN